MWSVLAVAVHFAHKTDCSIFSTTEWRIELWKSIRGKVGQWVYIGTVHLNTYFDTCFSSDVSVCFNFLPIPLLVVLWQHSWRFGCVAGCFQRPLPHHKVTATDSSLHVACPRKMKGEQGSKLGGNFGGRLIHLLGVHLLAGFAVSKLAMKNGSFWASYSVWQLLTMQPFNSIITFHSLWGAVSTTIQLYFSFLAGLICFLIHKQLILKRWCCKTAYFDSGNKRSLCV